jgi:hypothetical protein
MEVILAIIAAIATLKYTTQFFFAGGDDLLDCMKYWFRPARSRFLLEQWDGEFWRELRLFVWLLLGVLSGYAVYRFLLV